MIQNEIKNQLENATNIVAEYVGKNILKIRCLDDEFNTINTFTVPAEMYGMVCAIWGE